MSVSWNPFSFRFLYWIFRNSVFKCKLRIFCMLRFPVVYNMLFWQGFYLGYSFWVWIFFGCITSWKFVLFLRYCCISGTPASILNGPIFIINISFVTFELPKPRIKSLLIFFYNYAKVVLVNSYIDFLAIWHKNWKRKNLAPCLSF